VFLISFWILVPSGEDSSDVVEDKAYLRPGISVFDHLALAIYSSFQIQRLSKDAKAIIKDNYDSLVYCKGMFLALDDMKTAVTNQAVGIRAKQMSQSDAQLFAVGKTTFESNLAKERNNITEIHEGDYVKQLSSGYELYVIHFENSDRVQMALGHLTMKVPLMRLSCSSS
jgi:hypothetical protein